MRDIEDVSLAVAAVQAAEVEMAVARSTLKAFEAECRVAHGCSVVLPAHYTVEMTELLARYQELKKMLKMWE